MGGTLSTSEQTGPEAPTPQKRPAKRVSLQTVQRLSVYRKVLEELDRDGIEYIHSHELAELVGVTPAQLRRDLASFGTFGNISRGYNVYQMSRTISRIMGTDETQAVALFGVGDLGRALLSYRGFEERGFHIAVAFDVDSEKVGRVFAGRRCYHVDHLETVLREFDVHMAILASRPEGLQTLVDRVVRLRRPRGPQLRPQARQRRRKGASSRRPTSRPSWRCSRSWRGAEPGEPDRPEPRTRPEGPDESECFFRVYCERFHCEDGN